jgi:hydroxypyruvate isomerase
MTYIISRDRWYDIIVLNVHAPTEDKIDHVNGRFYEKLECLIGKFHKHHMKILLEDFNANVGSEYFFKPRIGNENLHEDSTSEVQMIEQMT